jgi:hypothetical protein
MHFCIVAKTVYALILSLFVTRFRIIVYLDNETDNAYVTVDVKTYHAVLDVTFFLRDSAEKRWELIQVSIYYEKFICESSSYQYFLLFILDWL